MEKGLLPIGTIVLLKGGTKKLMITGFYSKSADDDKIYQYNSCIFPEGFMDNTFVLFNHNQIDEVLYMGFKSNEHEKFVEDKASSVNIGGTGKGLKAGKSKSVEYKHGRVPGAPTNPLSIGEMRSKYGVNKISGENIKSMRKN